MDPILYKEEQGVRRNGLWFILLITPAIIITLLLYQRFSGKVIFDNTLDDIPLAIITVSYLIPAVFSLSRIKLVTIIDAEKISYGWNIPSDDLNEIPLADIQAGSIVEYKFVGYGFRRTHKYGMIYNVIGNKGLQIIKKSGGKVLIGTNNVEELQKVIKSLGLSA
ncbi:MAG: hypothetical protein PSX36_13770 [bacterium]|nr:hypothetical protein [bacterium]